MGRKSNKIELLRVIKRKTRLRVVIRTISFGRKREKRQEKRRDKRDCDFLQTKVRVSLAYNYINM